MRALALRGAAFGVLALAAAAQEEEAADAEGACRVSGRLRLQGDDGSLADFDRAHVEVLLRARGATRAAVTRSDVQGRFSLPIPGPRMSFRIALRPVEGDARLAAPTLVAWVTSRPRSDVDLGELVVDPAKIGGLREDGRSRSLFGEEPVDAEPGEFAWVTPLDGRLPAPPEELAGVGWVRGAVRGLPEGAPYTAYLLVRSLAEEEPMRLAPRVDAVGRFTVGELPPGRYRVGVHLSRIDPGELGACVRRGRPVGWLWEDGALVESDPFEVPAGAVVDLALDAEVSGGLDVHVRAAGEAAPWVRVMATPAGVVPSPDLDGDHFYDGPLAESESWVDGSCRFDALQAGAWKVWWRRAGASLSSGPVEVTVGPGTRRTLELEVPSAEASGRIDPKWWPAFGGGAPELRLFRAHELADLAYGPPEFPMHGSEPYFWRTSVRVGPDGGFTLRELPAGRYVLRVSTRGSQWPVQRVVAVEAGARIDLGDCMPEIYRVRRRIDRAGLDASVADSAAVIVRQRLPGFEQPATIARIDCREDFEAQLPAGSYELELHRYAAMRHRLTGWFAELTVGEGVPVREVLEFAPRRPR